MSGRFLKKILSNEGPIEKKGNVNCRKINMGIKKYFLFLFMGCLLQNKYIENENNFIYRKVK